MRYVGEAYVQLSEGKAEEIAADGMSRSEAVNYYLNNCSSGEGTGLVL